MVKPLGLKDEAKKYIIFLKPREAIFTIMFFVVVSVIVLL